MSSPEVFTISNDHRSVNKADAFIESTLAESVYPNLGEIREALAVEFGKLPILDEWNKDQGCFDPLQEGLRFSIPWIINDLLFYGLVFRPTLEEVCEKGNIRAELIAIERAAKGLLESLNSAHYSALLALEGMGQLPDEWKANLQELMTMAASIECSVPRGKPKKDIAQLIAYDLWRYFWILTGTQPTNGTKAGSFTAFLAQIYKILKISASAEDQAKIARRRFFDEHDTIEEKSRKRDH